MAASAVQWITIALVDLQNSRAGPLVQAFQQTALAANQSDPTPAIIADTVEEVLGVIAFSGRYTMDASYGTVSPNVIPPNLKRMVVEKICRTLKGRLSVALDASEQEDERVYQRRIVDLREGRWPIDLTNNPGNNLAVNPGSVGIVRGQRSFFRQGQLRNL